LAQRVTNVEVLRILLSIGPTEALHFQTWQDKAGNFMPLTDPTNGLVFPDLNKPPFGGEDFQTNLIMPEPTKFLSQPAGLLDRPPDRDGGRSHGCPDVSHEHGAFHRPDAGFLYDHATLGNAGGRGRARRLGPGKRERAAVTARGKRDDSRARWLLRRAAQRGSGC
jgi:hypothetical protein